MPNANSQIYNAVTVKNNAFFSHNLPRLALAANVAGQQTRYVPFRPILPFRITFFFLFPQLS